MVRAQHTHSCRTNDTGNWVQNLPTECLHFFLGFRSQYWYICLWSNIYGKNHFINGKHRCLFCLVTFQSACSWPFSDHMSFFGIAKFLLVHVSFNDPNKQQSSSFYYFFLNVFKWPVRFAQSVGAFGLPLERTKGRCHSGHKPDQFKQDQQKECLPQY